MKITRKVTTRVTIHGAKDPADALKFVADMRLQEHGCSIKDIELAQDFVHFKDGALEGTKDVTHEVSVVFEAETSGPMTADQARAGA